MVECNTILTAYTKYRHLGWCRTHPSICSLDNCNTNAFNSLIEYGARQRTNETKKKNCPEHLWDSKVGREISEIFTRPYIPHGHFRTGYHGHGNEIIH